MSNGGFQTLHYNVLYKRLNAESEWEIQLSFIKVDISRIYKTMNNVILLSWLKFLFDKVNVLQKCENVI